MRLVAAAALSASVALGAVAPAEADIKKTVRVPFLHCEVTVEVNDVTVSVYRRDVPRVERWGNNGVTSTC